MGFPWGSLGSPGDICGGSFGAPGGASGFRWGFRGSPGSPCGGFWGPWERFGGALGRPRGSLEGPRDGFCPLGIPDCALRIAHLILPDSIRWPEGGCILQSNSSGN